MDGPSIARVSLRLAHAIAAVVWLGGGVYYILALRPAVRKAGDEHARTLAQQAQRAFGEWASIATLVLIISGVVLMWDRLADGRGTWTYIALLALKVAAAVVAFWLAGSFGRQRRGRPRPRPRRVSAESPHRAALDRAWLILTLGTLALVVGVVLSTIYPTGVGS